MKWIATALTYGLNLQVITWCKDGTLKKEVIGKKKMHFEQMDKHATIVDKRTVSFKVMEDLVWAWYKLAVETI